MQIVPLEAVPNQTVTTTLGDQVCQIDVYENAYGVYLDLYVVNVLIVGGAICEDRNRVVRSLYLGFEGDLAFIDTQGTADPDYLGFGPTTSARYVLAYLTPEELGGLG